MFFYLIIVLGVIFAYIASVIASIFVLRYHNRRTKETKILGPLDPMRGKDRNFVLLVAPLFLVAIAYRAVKYAVQTIGQKIGDFADGRPT